MGHCNEMGLVQGQSEVKPKVDLHLLEARVEEMVQEEWTRPSQNKPEPESSVNQLKEMRENQTLMDPDLPLNTQMTMWLKKMSHQRKTSRRIVE